MKINPKAPWFFDPEIQQEEGSRRFCCNCWTEFKTDQQGAACKQCGSTDIKRFAVGCPLHDYGYGMAPCLCEPEKGEGYTCATCVHVNADTAGFATCEHYRKSPYVKGGPLVTGHVQERTLPWWCPLVDKLAKALGEEPVKQPRQCLACDHTEQTCPHPRRRKQNRPRSSSGNCPSFWQDT